jgi:organic radical activating enzyme
VALEVSGKCTNNCRHCYARELRQQGDMSVEFAETCLEAVQMGGYQEVYIVGGEPMMNKDVVAICRRAKEKGLRVILVSNGYGLWEEQKAKDVISVVDEIQLSVRSSIPEEHDNFISNRNSGESGSVLPDAVTYEKVMKAFTTLNECNPDNRVLLTVNHDLYKNGFYPRDTGMMWEIARHIVKDLGVPLGGFYGQLIDFSGRAEQKKGYFANEVQIEISGLVQALNDLKKMQGELGIKEVGITDNPVSLGIIKSLAELPEGLMEMAEGEVVPAISPRGQIRRNVVDL